MELTKLMSRVLACRGSAREGGDTLFCLISLHVQIRCYIDANHYKISACKFTVNKMVGALHWRQQEDEQIGVGRGRSATGN